MLTSEKIDNFLCDENYLALTESSREQRLLFITEMTETRVSAFFGWLFRPNEGHGLGDQAIRELLHNAWLQVQSGEWEGPSAKEMGFSGWNPSSLATKSFRDLCVETEYRFGKSESTGKKNRPVDVVLVSRANRLVILIENKFGSSVHGGQLAAYRKQADDNFSGFKVFRIYLDPNADNRPDDLPHWINLRYEWLIELISVKQQSGLLSRGALDALSQVKDYLKQESAGSGNDQRQAQISALVDDHADVLTELSRIRALGRHGRLTATSKQVSVVNEVLLVEYHQRHTLWDDVFNQMAHVKLIELLRKSLGERIDIKKFTKHLAFRNSAWGNLKSQDVKPEAAWGIRMAAWKPDATKNIYNVRSVIDFSQATSMDGAEVPMFSGDQEAALRTMAAKIRKLKKKSSKQDRWIRLMEQKDLSPEAAARALTNELIRIDQALQDEHLVEQKKG